MASKQGYGADLRQYMDQKVEIHLNAERRVIGILKGYDPFMNVVLDEAEWIKSKDQTQKLGTIVIRGNSIKFWENLDRAR